MRKVTTGVATLAGALLLLGCTATGERAAEGAPAQPGEVGVQLFQWTWPAIAAECTNTLGPAGYTWVMTSPPQEHVLGPEWWTAYQPVSYRIESRLGTREEFAEMVSTCAQAGVAIYADAVINHMSGITDDVTDATGWAGSPFTHYDYPGLYRPEDFHDCGLTPDNDIADYSDAEQVRTCELVNLADLRTGTEHVRATITAYLQDLVDLGVSGLRIDAAKHMEPEDIAAIVEPLGQDIAILQEVIRGAGEPIQPEDYLGAGDVYEFAWGRDVVGLLGGSTFGAFERLGDGPGYAPQEQAYTFVDNHDTERNESTLTYADGPRYALANVLMLAGTYGTPVVYSGYAFSHRDTGPLLHEDGRVIGAECVTDPGPGQDHDDGDWICQHAWPQVLGMVGLHHAVHGTSMTDVWSERHALAFGREDAGFVVVNRAEEPLSGSWSTSLEAGEYCNVIDGPMTGDTCAGASVQIGPEGTLVSDVPGLGAIAIHRDARPGG